MRITTLIKKQEHSYQRGTQRNTYHGTLILIFSLTYCEKKYDNKKYLIFLCCFHSKDHPCCPTWTLDFEPAFSPRFYSTLSPRSIFQTAQRFLLQNHVTSGLGDVTSGSGHVTSGSGHVTSGCLSPRSFSPPDQRFPPSVTTQPHNQSQLRTGGVYAN